MCVRADRCGTLPYLTFTLLWTDYGDDGTCNRYCYCCLLLLLLMMIMIMFCLLAAAAAVAAACIGGNIR